MQIAFASMYLLVTLILLLSAIRLGLSFANWLVLPIRRLIHATDQVAAGNFYVQVPTRKGESDLAHLSATFNGMTQELRAQHDRLVAASDMMDKRRRFTEAVLAGVSSGVIGIDAKGAITVLNPSADKLLPRGEGKAPRGASLDELLPGARPAGRGGARRPPPARAGADRAAARDGGAPGERARHQGDGGRCR